MNLLAIAELAWRQLFPRPSDETRITREEFIETAKAEYAYQMWRISKEEKAQEGIFNIPSYLLTEEVLEVKDNEIDISKLKILRSLTDDTWLQSVGGLTCDCEYVRSTINMEKTLCDDDYQYGVPYVVIGNKIKFPKGLGVDKLPIIYANNGNKIDGSIDIDDAVGAIVRNRLVELYGGKTGVEDKTNNSNSNN